MSHIDLVTEGIYRISHIVTGSPVTLNQFLIEDECPALIHTGTYPLFEQVRKAIAEVLDPARLAYVIVPHFEADECGGMGRFIAGAPEAVLVGSATGAVLNLDHWDYAGPVKGVCEGDVIHLGRHALRFWETPHVHHWDAMMILEEATRSLFPADLFLQPEAQPAIMREDLSREMCRFYRQSGIFPAREPVLQVVDRVEQFSPAWVHPMHGGSLPGESLSPYVEALRTESFVFEGKLLGRTLPGW